LNRITDFVSEKRAGVALVRERLYNFASFIFGRGGAPGGMMKESNSQLFLALRSVMWQLLVLVFICCAIFCFMPSQGLTFLCGGVVVALPNIAFAYYFFSGWRKRTAKQIILTFYVGEVIKMLLSGVLAIFFVKWFHLGLGMFIVGMVVAYLTFWVVAPLMMQQRKGVSG